MQKILWNYGKTCFIKEGRFRPSIALIQIFCHIEVQLSIPQNMSLRYEPILCSFPRLYMILGMKATTFHKSGQMGMYKLLLMCPCLCCDFISYILMVKFITEFFSQMNRVHIVSIPARIQTFVQTFQYQS